MKYKITVEADLDAPTETIARARVAQFLTQADHNAQLDLSTLTVEQIPEQLTAAQILKVKPCAVPGDHRMGGLINVRPKEIEQILGFPQNAPDDTSKVAYSWGFTVELNGETVRCGIWDYYKGGDREGRWSYFGPTAVMEQLFGPASVTL
jgi:hypothetical protein